jgi:hypothetical protein
MLHSIFSSFSHPKDLPKKPFHFALLRANKKGLACANPLMLTIFIVVSQITKTKASGLPLAFVLLCFWFALVLVCLGSWFALVFLGFSLLLKISC